LRSISFSDENLYYILDFADKNSMYYDAITGNQIKHPIIKVLNSISDFHHTLFLHKYLLIFFGLLLVCLLLSGILIAKKYSLEKIFSQKKVSFLKIHIFLGILFSPLLLLVVLSGSFLPVNKIILKNLFSYNIIYPSLHITKEEKKIDFLKLYNVVNTKIEKGKITRIYLPKKKHGEFKFRIKYADELHPNGKSYILINPYTYNIIQTIDSREHPFLLKFFQNIYTFHTGKIDNIVNPLLLIIIIFVFLIFAVFSFKKR
jgi:uncharacterized iron-regulated membrane protein